MSVYERIKVARRMLQVTQTDAAEASGMRQGDVSRIESGIARFVPNEYFEWLVGRGVNLNWLYTGEGAPMQGEAVLVDMNNVAVGDLDTMDSEGLKQTVMKLHAEIDALRKENEEQKNELLHLYRIQNKVNKVLMEKFNIDLKG